MRKTCTGIRGHSDLTENYTKRVWYAGWIVLAAAALLLFLVGKGVLQLPSVEGGCVFRKYLSVYCPACGGTRAVIELSHGNLPASFAYHAAVPLAAAWILWFQLSHLIEYASGGRLRMGLRLCPGWLIFFVMLFIINMIVKNLAAFV